MTRIVLALALLAVAVGTAQARATKGPPYLLEEGTWLCATPEDYDRAVAEQAKTNGYPELKALKERLLATRAACIVDEEHIEDMMAPFVTVVDRQGDKVKVEFWVEFYKRSPNSTGPGATSSSPAGLRRSDWRTTTRSSG